MRFRKNHAKAFVSFTILSYQQRSTEMLCLNRGYQSLSLRTITWECPKHYYFYILHDDIFSQAICNFCQTQVILIQLLFGHIGRICVVWQVFSKLQFPSELAGTIWGSLLTLSLGFLCKTRQDCLEMVHIWVLSQQEEKSWIPHFRGWIYHCLFPLLSLSVLMTNHNRTSKWCLAIFCSVSFKQSLLVSSFKIQGLQHGCSISKSSINFTCATNALKTSSIILLPS